MRRLVPSLTIFAAVALLLSCCGQGSPGVEEEWESGSTITRGWR